MNQRNKQYPIHQSIFYKLRSKKDLADVLNISNEVLIQLTDSSHYYRVFTNKEGRDIQETLGIRKIVHRRIKKLLSRIISPDYLFSGVKNKSYIKNASFHQINKYMMTADIKSFYRTTNIEFVFRFFKYKLMMDDDVARIISQIICYKKIIPTGSPVSQIIAYWAYASLFDNVAKIALDRGMTFSLYVDDMTFSSTTKIDKEFDLHLNRLLNSVSLSLKKKKTRYYFSNDQKFVTGCIISSDNKLKVQNKHKKKVVELYKASNKITDDSEKEKAIRSVKGLLLHTQQIEPNLFSGINRQINQPEPSQCQHNQKK